MIWFHPCMLGKLDPGAHDHNLEDIFIARFPCSKLRQNVILKL